MCVLAATIIHATDISADDFGLNGRGNKLLENVDSPWHVCG